MEATLDLDGHRLEAYFQRYECLLPGSGVQGELLTRLDPQEPPESYFASLTIPQQFEVLSWHLALKDELSRSLGAKVSINVHNSLVESDADRFRFLDLVGLSEAPAVFEFTETYPMPAVEVSNRLFRDIRDRGHHSALDDFGIGLNGMSLLTDYDFDVIKLDRSLTFDLDSRVEKQKTLGLIAQILEVLGKDHVVEGIESQEVFDLLVASGFTTFQGFRFHRPEPVAGILAHLGEEVS